MADAADIQYVKDNIERNFADNGWKEEDIVSRLDSGENKNRIVAAYWRGRSNDVILLVNTSESGSSRGNDAIYQRMNAKADAYEAKAEKEEDASGVTTEQTLGSFDIERA